MQDLAVNVGSDGKSALADKREHLTVDRKPRPAQHKGSHRKRLGKRAGSALQAPDAGGQLNKPGEEPFRPGLIKTEGGKNSPDSRSNKRKQTRQKQQFNKNRKENDKTADVQRRLKGGLDRFDKGGREAFRGRRGQTDPAFFFIFAAPEPEDKADADGRQRMHKI